MIRGMTDGSTAHAYTIVAAPRIGTVLAVPEILQIVKSPDWQQIGRAKSRGSKVTSAKRSGSPQPRQSGGGASQASKGTSKGAGRGTGKSGRAKGARR